MVTLDTWVTGWRPRDLAAANFPQLRGHCLANYFSDPRFAKLMGGPPVNDLRAAITAIPTEFAAKIFFAPGYSPLKEAWAPQASHSVGSAVQEANGVDTRECNLNAVPDHAVTCRGRRAR